MLPDNRLDFIENISEEYVDLMTKTRKLFIEVDEILREFSKSVNYKNEGAGRCLSLARTNLEISLQYTIKTLCLMGEKTSEEPK